MTSCYYYCLRSSCFLEVVDIGYFVGLSPPRIPVANEGLGWDSLLSMVHNPGGDDCILGRGTTQVTSLHRKSCQAEADFDREASGPLK